MNPQLPKSRSIILATAVGSALLLAGSAAAAPSAQGRAMMSHHARADAVELPPHAKAGSGLVGEIDADALNARTLSLTLPDGRTVDAQLQRVAKDDRKGSLSWVGTFDDAPGSVLVLTKYKGVITGFANYGDQVLELQPTTGGGGHLMFEVDTANLPDAEVVRQPQAPAADAFTTADDFGLGGAAAAAGDNIVQDVLVVYTAASASRHGQATLESRIQSAVDSANQAYLNSQINITLNAVGIQQTTLSEQSNMDATVTALQTDRGVGQLRDQLGADMVILVSENSEYCGLSNLMTSNSTSFAPYAFGVVYSSCLSNQSLAHELGHQQGVMHDRVSSSGWGGVYPYSYGYRVCTSDGTGFRDIMSYSCSGAPRVLVFSNPDVTWNGHAAGISYEANPSNSAENARSMNNTAATVAAFRGSSSGGGTPTPPAAPSNLDVSAAEYNRVTVAWRDNASNETGFKLERSDDGVAFAEIATLGADTSSYTDGSVNAGADYYYRVRAFNSTGTSGYSNNLNVRVPDAPPPPPQAPTSVGASDNADGSATVSWSAGSGSTATGFEVQRESYDSRRNRWRGATTVANVSANVLSIVDVSGSGLFRYSVRAVNGSGSSAYAGPSQVDVTGGSSSGSGGKGKGKGRK